MHQYVGPLHNKHKCHLKEVAIWIIVPALSYAITP